MEVLPTGADGLRVHTLVAVPRRFGCGSVLTQFQGPEGKTAEGHAFRQNPASSDIAQIRVRASYIIVTNV